MDTKHELAFSKGINWTGIELKRSEWYGAVAVQTDGSDRYDRPHDVFRQPELRRIFVRSSLVDRPKPTNAFLAAAMARFVSSSSASVTRPITRPFVGLMMSMTSVP